MRGERLSKSLQLFACSLENASIAFQFCWYILIKKCPWTVWPGCLTLHWCSKMLPCLTPHPQNHTQTKLKPSFVRKLLAAQEWDLSLGLPQGTQTRPPWSVISSHVIPTLCHVLFAEPSAKGKQHSQLQKSKCHRAAMTGLTSPFVLLSEFCTSHRNYPDTWSLLL